MVETDFSPSFVCGMHRRLFSGYSSPRVRQINDFPGIKSSPRVNKGALTLFNSLGILNIYPVQDIILYSMFNDYLFGGIEWLLFYTVWVLGPLILLV
jgi:hypothetical protein